MIAAMEGHLSVIHFLINRSKSETISGAHMIDNEGLTASELAVIGGNADVLEAILHQIPKAQSDQAIRLLVLAARKGHEAVLATLLEHFHGLHFRFDIPEDLLSKAQGIAENEKQPEAAQLLGATLERVIQDEQQNHHDNLSSDPLYKTVYPVEPLDVPAGPSINSLGW